MSSIAVAHRLLARPRPAAFMDAAVAAGVFAGAVVLLAHGGAPGAGRPTSTR